MIFILISMGILILFYLNDLSAGKKIIKTKPVLLETKKYQILHRLSYYQPFDYFLNGAESSVKTKKLQEDLICLNLNNKFTLRSFLTFQYVVFLLVIILIIGIYAIPVSKGVVSNELFLIISIVLMIIALYPKQIIKSKNKKKKYFYNDEVIVLQLFIILLLKSSSNIEDVLFSLSNMKSFYKNIFENAYRISFRSKEEALDYLENFFKESKFGDTFEVLAKFSEYSRKESINILEANLRILEKESLNKRRQDELIKFSYSQMSIVIPLISVVFWGAIPVIYYAINNMTSQILTM